MDELQTTYRDGWYLRTARGVYGFVAWCKREMFTGSDVIDEPGDVWFGLGSNREDAISNLWRDLPAN